LDSVSGCGERGYRQAATLVILSHLRGIASIVLTATLVAAAGAAADDGTDPATDVVVKAAFLYNFAQFAVWPALPSGAPIIGCVVGDDRIAAALVETVRGHTISDHALEVWRPGDSAAWRVCHLLFIADAETGRSVGALDEIRTLPILTVSDGHGFSEEGGIIERYLEGGRIRFAINTDSLERSGLRLSSRLLGLAKIVRSGRGQ
jgi:hypothetical protein